MQHSFSGKDTRWTAQYTAPQQATIVRPMAAKKSKRASAYGSIPSRNAYMRPPQQQRTTTPMIT
eukprot:7891555-Pyramimonas_sp.AAC.1